PNVLPSAASLPSNFTIQGNGEFSATVGPVTMNLDGYTVAQARFTFARVGPNASLTVTAGDFNPGFGSSIDLRGTILSSGTMNLSHTFNSGSQINGFNVQGNAQLVSGPSRYETSVELDQPYAYWRLGDLADKTGVIVLAV